MPRLSLDTAALDDAAAACRDAAGLLQGSAVLALPPEPFGVPELVAALDDLRRAWARDLGLLDGQVSGLADALVAARALYTQAEAAAVQQLGASGELEVVVDRDAATAALAGTAAAVAR